MDWISVYHELVQSNLISQKDAAKILGIRPTNLKKIWNERGLESKPVGRPLKKISITLVEEVINYKKKFNVGYQRCCKVMKRKGFKTSEYEIQTIFEKEGLFNYEIEFKNSEENRKNYVAKFVNQLWHTDLHEVTVEGQKKYLIAFLDDRSKFIIHYSILEDKSMISTSNALIEAIQKVSQRPARLIIDNGTEFIGHIFQDILKKNHIKDWRIEPYTPQQNGKIERFWGTIIRAANKEQSFLSQIDSLIQEYNMVWEQKSLKPLYGKSLTPIEAWNNGPQWLSYYNDEIVYF